MPIHETDLFEMGDSPDIPPGILPPCDVGYLTERLVLWEGGCDFADDHGAMTGQGTVEVDLFPSPRARFSFQGDQGWERKHWLERQLGDAELRVEAPIGTLRVNTRRSDGHEFSGEVGRDAQGDELRAVSARYLVVNGPETHAKLIQREKATYSGRHEAEVDGCRIVVDRLLYDAPPVRSVFAFTHVAELNFGAEVSVDAIDSSSSTLFRALSLMRGRWVGLVGPWLYSKDGTLTKVIPAVTRATPAGNSPSWCHQLMRGVFEKLVPCLHQAYGEERRGEALTTGIHWLIESGLCAGDVEGALVLQQAALESLAWFEIVQNRGLCSTEGFEKLPAADRIRWLASVFSISLEIPSQSAEIAAFAREFNLIDLVGVLAHSRNAIVHGIPKKIEKLFGRPRGADERTELWYQIGAILDQCVLGIAGYSGDILRRDVDCEYASGAIKPVPWSNGQQN